MKKLLLEDKKQFLMKSYMIAKLAFEGISTAEIVNSKLLCKLARKHFGYSKNTVDCDILSSLKKAWESI